MPAHRPRALITGASGGVGGAVAHALGATHELLLGGRDAAALAELAATLPSADPWPVDLTDWDAVRRATEAVDRLDALVHAAGIWEAGRVIDTTPESWRRLLDVNVVAVAELSRRLLPALRAAGGRIVMINSVAGTRVTAGRGAYGASKFALRALGEALHAEESAGGVGVTTIYLGRVATDMQRRVKSVEGQPFEAERYLAPESVAAAVVSVLSAPADADVTEIVLHPTLGPR
jgi:NADP-dependent 3-hydroxy acid dehydrogenase YdfG